MEHLVFGQNLLSFLYPPKVNVAKIIILVQRRFRKKIGPRIMNNPAASCGVSLKDTETALGRSKLRGTDSKRD